MEAIRAAGLKLGVDPLGGAAVHYWEPINEVYGLDITVVNPKVDPTFSFMTVDHDGKIRMDCSSPYAMAGSVGLKDRYRVAFANDPDSDRHGIVTPSAGLMNPNHYLAVAIRYLLTHRPEWPADAAVGKTLVSSSMIDRVVAKARPPACARCRSASSGSCRGCSTARCCFGGEESAGASFLRRDGTVWTTDKDGPIMDLLAAEITARTGKDPGEHYRELTAEFGTPYYTRIDAPGDARAEGAARKACRPRPSRQSTLAGEPITAKLTRAPGNNAPIGGLKVVAASGWFAARPSGTENIYKIYAESFQGRGAPGRHRRPRPRRSSQSAIGQAESEMTDAASQSHSPFRRDIAPPACCCTSRRCRRLTASAMWGRRRWPGSTASTRQARAGGRRCRWDQRATATRRINPCRLSPATGC